MHVQALHAKASETWNAQAGKSGLNANLEEIFLPLPLLIFA